MPHIALVSPSGKDKQTETEKTERISRLEEEGFTVTDLTSAFPSPNDITAAPLLDRATLLAHALTNRKFDIIMATRGGYGVTELIPYLDLMLPPAISNKTFVGFSDNSYLGVYLSLKYENLRYIHAKHAFSSELFDDYNNQKTALFDLLNNKNNNYPFEKCKIMSQILKTIAGPCIPLNLSLAESIAATKNIALPLNTILFLEDLNEYVYRMFRKLDSLQLSGALNNVSAVVLGEFSKPLRNNDEEMPRDELLQVIAEKIQKPVIDFPYFGHEKACFPLVAHSIVSIEQTSEHDVKLTLTSEMPKRNSCQVESALEHKFHNLHLCGIGGTGMASVAGLLKQAGYHVTGSDKQKIYPPMDKVLADLSITPDIGYRAENILDRKIDGIVMGNVMSRKTASLENNPELDAILNTKIPIMSFPSALRKLFLKDSFNIIVSGTHGKTTTSTLCAFLLEGLGENPSYLIGGMPGNFTSGFKLDNKKLFVLEADEYDSALFDKGPKFLHYLPNVAIINNIEFDHADIYDSIEQIEAEFLRLALLTQKRNGINVVNWNDERVRKIATILGANCIAFASNLDCHSRELDCHSREGGNPPAGSSVKLGMTQRYPTWTLKSFETHTTGITIQFTAPDQSNHSLFVQQMFGAHNALNIVAIIAALHAKSMLQGLTLSTFLKSLEKISEIAKNFKGIKRRFEFLSNKNDIAIFEDFAHHPTAIRTTLDAFRQYMSLANRKGRLIVCFDPHNATLRRNVLQDELSKSFTNADLLYLGKIPKDLRTNPSLILDENTIIQQCGIPAEYFSENEVLLQKLQQEVKPKDTVVFMSSGSFDGIIHKFVGSL